VKAVTYPPRLFISIPVIPARSAEKQLKMRNVVETGILRRVMISKKIGAASCKKEKLVGATDRAGVASRW